MNTLVLLGCILVTGAGFASGQQYTGEKLKVIFKSVDLNMPTCDLADDRKIENPDFLKNYSESRAEGQTPLDGGAFPKDLLAMFTSDLNDDAHTPYNVFNKFADPTIRHNPKPNHFYNKMNAEEKATIDPATKVDPALETFLTQYKPQIQAANLTWMQVYYDHVKIQDKTDPMNPETKSYTIFEIRGGTNQ